MAKNSSQETEITVKYNCGYGNSLFIRGAGTKGRGANGKIEPLSWNKGILLKNIAPDEWVFWCQTPLNSCEFKLLLNDELYELGSNHILIPQTKNLIIPYF